jgi:hypothetical protein
MVMLWELQGLPYLHPLLSGFYMYRAAIACILGCLLASNNVFSQVGGQEGQYRFVSLHFNTGGLFYSGTEDNNGFKDDYQAFELKLGWQSKRSQEWAGPLNYPSYGVGLYYGLVGDAQVFGHPHAVFGFMAVPLTQERRLTFQVEPAAGIGFNLKPYDSLSNPDLSTLGGRFSFYFALQAEARYRVSRTIDLQGGMNFHHMSNGRVLHPNLGINLLGMRLGATWHFRRLPKEAIPEQPLQVRPTNGHRTKPRPNHERSVALYQAFGVAQNKVDIGTRMQYLTSTTLLEYQRALNSMHSVSAGAEVFLDYSARDTAEYDIPPGSPVFFPAVHAGYGLSFWRLAIRIQAGTYLTAWGREQKGTFFLRPNLRYDISPRLFGQVGLKTITTTADWIEFGIGYKFYRSTTGNE